MTTEEYLLKRVLDLEKEVEDLKKEVKLANEFITQREITIGELDMKNNSLREENKELKDLVAHHAE